MRFDQATLDVFRNAKVIPVVTVQSVTQAQGVATALVAGGLDVIEVTLRTGAALDAIRALKNERDELIVGAGTITTPTELANAETAGTDFIVTPGTPPVLLAALAESKVPAIPGAQTAGEIMTMRERGFDLVKYFPAEACGGVEAIKAFSGPFPAVKFVPTGGIGLTNARAYLDLPNVLAVGGSWIAPAKAIEAGDWDQITRNALSAKAL